MQQSFQIPSDYKQVSTLNIVDTQNQDKFKMILDRLEEKVFGQIKLAVETNNELSLKQLKQAFHEARSGVK